MTRPTGEDAMSSEHVEVLRNLSEVCRAAIKAGDWKVDGACDPDSFMRHADAAIAALSAPQPPAEAIELTVCCGREECGGECGSEWRGMEWVRKDMLPPAEAQPVGGGEVVYHAKDETLGAWYDVAKARWDNYDSHLRRAVYTTPPSAPVGAEALRDLRDRVLPAALRHHAHGPGYIEEAQEIVTRALSQQPAAVDEAMVEIDGRLYSRETVRTALLGLAAAIAAKQGGDCHGE